MRAAFTIFLSLCLWVTTSHAQSRYKTSMGRVEINASTPLEDINALNSTTNGILDPATGNFAAVMLVKEFEFDRKLMQEHFNENYMESDKYPKATFSGTIEEFNPDFSADMPAIFDLKGKLQFHGVTRPLNTTVRLSKKGNTIILDSDFIVKPEDFDIEVPRLVFQKIAREVVVSVHLELLAE